MIVVLASGQDQAAVNLVSSWASKGAVLCSIGDLSTSGWNYLPGNHDASTVVVGGQIIPQPEITGVLTRRAWVREDELIHIVPADRAYVAAEMSAFLISWLSSLGCPVLNPPTPSCLSGPNWRHEQWVRAAAQAGLPVRPSYRRVPALAETREQASQAPVTYTTVVGDLVLGALNGIQCDHARRLARMAGANLLGITFAGDFFSSATTWPDLNVPGVADTILHYFETTGNQA